MLVEMVPHLGSVCSLRVVLQNPTKAKVRHLANQVAVN